MRKQDVLIQIRLEMLQEMIERKMELTEHLGVTREQASHEAYMDITTGQCDKEIRRRFRERWAKYYRPRVKRPAEGVDNDLR